MIFRTTAAISLALALATPLAAQNPTTYQRPATDTLRYREVSEATSDGGPMAGESRREATVALAFLGGDTVRAWFEALNQTGRTGGREPAAPSEALLNRPFLLQVAGNGAVQMLSGPPGQGPMTLGLIARLFLKLPDRPLAVGVEWSDTTVLRPMGPPAPGSPPLLIVRYKVVRDTTTAGGKAVIIEAKGDASSRSSTPGPRGGSMDVSTRTSEKGRIVFSLGQGRLLSWDRTVESLRRTSSSGADAGASPAPGRAAANPRGKVNLGADDSRGSALRTSTHTVVQLVTDEAKAAPAK